MAPPITRAHHPVDSLRLRLGRTKAAPKLTSLKSPSMRRKPLERHQTLRERILETIREAILNGTLQPGEKVSEPDLAERFGISRTPIREALRQLESEGYLEVIPRRGAIVAALSEKDVEEYYAIKSILESYAARIAAERMTAKDIERLEHLNNRLEQLAMAGDVKTFFRVHGEYHEMFVRAAGNDRLSELIGQLGLKFNRMKMAALAVPGRMEISVQEHKKIIEALRLRNGDIADAMVRETAAHGAQILIQSLASAEGRETAVDASRVVNLIADV